jgi:CRISPR-associated protein Cas2
MSQTTLYVVAYDIEDDKRRTRVHKLLCAYGKWTQYSLFECHLTRLQRVELRDRLDMLVNPDTDSVRFYPLCDACIKRVDIIGGVQPQDPPLFLL